MKKVVAVLGVIFLFFALFSGASVADSHRVTICHATASTTNPFVVQTPSKASILNGSAHSEHQHQEDIIPPFTYDHPKHGGDFEGRNWNETGQEIWNNGCDTPSDKETPEESTEPEQPVETEKPEESETPEEREDEKPVETEAPEEREADKPVETEKTEAPAESEAPVEEAPVEVEVPVEPEQPEAVPTTDVSDDRPAEPVEEAPDDEVSEAGAEELPNTGVGSYILMGLALALLGSGWYTLRST